MVEQAHPLGPMLFFGVKLPLQFHDACLPCPQLCLLRWQLRPCRRCLTSSPVPFLQTRIVPLIVSHDMFWTRYFYRLHLLHTEHEKRQRLTQSAAPPQVCVLLIRSTSVMNT